MSGIIDGPIHGPPRDDVEAFAWALDRLMHTLWTVIAPVVEATNNMLTDMVSELFGTPSSDPNTDQ
jgi:hypothetical protein